MNHFIGSIFRRSVRPVSTLLLLVSCTFAAQAEEPPTSPSILFFGLQKERDIAFDDGLVHVRKATEATVTYVASEGEFEELIEKNVYDFVLCADQEICDQRGGELKVYILAGNPVATVATLEEEFEMSLFVDDVDLPMLKIRVPTIWEIIEWLECRGWCIKTTKPLTQARRDCDQDCNEAADKRAGR